MDEVMSPKKPVSKITTSNQEPTLSAVALHKKAAPCQERLKPSMGYG
ncbi:MAG: hypothetical protein IKX40_10135 [Thermoguttaceae bacterium]|nr:hypothetical protein [Thermoguttaceae bacterium]